jgi:LuxR family maltose regulon positive regulatory protein
LQVLCRSALSGGRSGRIVEIRMLQALVQAQRQETAGALAWLEEALVLAEPEGYVRLFADEGQPLFHLLSVLSSKAHSPVSPGYLQQILAAFPSSADTLGQTGIPPGNRLTESELRTLRLLATERPIKEIAAELSVSVSTVRTYSKRIYGKLDVHSRAEAVYRAKELQLL